MQRTSISYWSIACYFINNVNMHLSILVNWNNILLEQVNVLRSFWTLVINLTFKLFSSSFWWQLSHIHLEMIGWFLISWLIRTLARQNSRKLKRQLSKDCGSPDKQESQTAKPRKDGVLVQDETSEKGSVCIKLYIKYII